MRSDGRIIGRGWDAFSDELDALPKDVWQNIHLWRSWPAEDAIRAGVGFARMAARSLAPRRRDGLPADRRPAPRALKDGPWVAGLAGHLSHGSQARRQTSLADHPAARATVA